MKDADDFCPKPWKLEPVFVESSKQDIDINQVAKKISEEILRLKEAALIEAVEKIEGRVPSNFEVKQFGSIHKIDGEPDKEWIFWRGKIILKFEIVRSSGKIELKITKNSTIC